MPKTFLATLALAIMLCFSSASAFSWTYYDFGSAYFDEHNNTADINYPGGVGSLPSPGNLGEGGEKFDIEGLNYSYDDDFVYLSVTSSFSEGAYSTGWNQTYGRGDLFFGFGGSKYDYAITSDGRLVDVATWNSISNKPGTYYSYTSIRDAAGAWRVGTGSNLGSVDILKSYDATLETNPMFNGGAGTYVWEYRFSKSLLSDFGSGAITFHQTLECGNDLLEKQYESVPEPATMVLFGIGLAGLGAKLRGRKKLIA